MDDLGTEIAYGDSSIMRVLVLTRIFPNTEEPLSSPFNRQQLAALAARCDVEVIAPVPWFPGARALGRTHRAGRLTKVLPYRRLDGMTVRHPRALYLPVIGAALAVPFYSLSVGTIVERYRGRCNVLLTSWLYPDACSALRLAEKLGVPCVVKTHGSDVHHIARRLDVKPIVRAHLPRAAAVVAPSKPLVRALVSLGSPAEHTHHVPNGVDKSIFLPRSREAARAALELPRDDRLVIFVGRLTREKGVAELLRAHAKLNDVTLALIGDGPMRGSVDAQIHRGARVIAAGAQPLPRVADWMAAADVIVLPSWSEGTPNVVLEALAMGRPVVASKVGGIPDVMIENQTGYLVPPRNEQSLKDALERALARKWNEQDIAALGPSSWEESASLLERVLTDAIARHENATTAAA